MKKLLAYNINDNLYIKLSKKISLDPKYISEFFSDVVCVDFETEEPNSSDLTIKKEMLISIKNHEGLSYRDFLGKNIVVPCSTYLFVPHIGGELIENSIKKECKNYHDFTFIFTEISPDCKKVMINYIDDFKNPGYLFSDLLYNLCTREGDIIDYEE